MHLLWHWEISDTFWVPEHCATHIYNSPLLWIAFPHKAWLAVKRTGIALCDWVPEWGKMILCLDELAINMKHPPSCNIFWRERWYCGRTKWKNSFSPRDAALLYFFSLSCGIGNHVPPQIICLPKSLCPASNRKTYFCDKTILGWINKETQPRFALAHFFELDMYPRYRLVAYILPVCVRRRRTSDEPGHNAVDAHLNLWGRSTCGKCPVSGTS